LSASRIRHPVIVTPSGSTTATVVDAFPNFAVDTAARGFAAGVFFAWACGTGTVFGAGAVQASSVGCGSDAVASAGSEGSRVAIRIAVAIKQTAASPITPAPVAFAKRGDFFELTAV
jgi:hypothetical protein